MKTPWYLRPFRASRTASSAWNVSKTLAQTVVFWTVFLLLFPWMIVRIEERLGMSGFAFAGQAVIPWFLFAVAGTLGLVSGVTMATRGQGTPLPLDGPRQLVVAGPYRYVRNPMAIAGLAQGICVALYLGSWLTIAYALAGGLFWNYVVRPIEEQHLDMAFGDNFREYRKAVPCWVPRLRPFQSRRA